MKISLSRVCIILLALCCQQTYAQTTLVNGATVGGFESGTTFLANGWTVVNNGGNGNNDWFVGNTPTGETGARCAYVEEGGNPSAHSYNITASSVVHFYRDVTIPAGEPNLTLTFNWKNYGESCCDYIRVHWVPTTTTPVVGTTLTTGQLGANLNLQGTDPWQLATFTMCGTPGTTMRLVFTWRNDGSVGTDPPAAVDNIHLVSSATGPTCASLLGTGVVNVPSLPYNSGAGTTCGTGNDLTSTNVITCGSTSYWTGEDRVFVFTPTTSGCISLAVNSTGSWMGMMLYEGCPVSAACSGSTATCVGYSQSSLGNQSITGVSVTAGTTYYLVLDSYASPTCNAYSSVTISAPSAGPSNDAPCSATPLTLGASTAGTNICAGATGNPILPSCFVAGTSNTVFYSFIAPASGQASITLTPGTITSAQMGIYSGACGSLAVIAGSNCSTSSNPLCLSGLTPGATYYILVDGQANNQGTFNILVTNPATTSCTSLLGTGVTTVASLPYFSGAGTTCGSVDDLTSSNMVICNSSCYYGGEDRVYVFTPTVSGQVSVSMLSTGTWNGIMLYNGCPLTTVCAGVPGTCVANSQSSAGNQSFCANVIAGVTYYLVVDVCPSPYCNTFSSISISAPSAAPAGTICSNAPAITLPFTATNHTTACYGNDYTNASTGSCGTLYESGEDRVYAYTATGPECIGVSISAASTSNIGFQVYSGCPGTAGTTCIGSYGGSALLTGSVNLPAAGTYYIVVDTWANPMTATYDISVQSYGSGPTNDLPCNAIPLTLGVAASGDNTCSGSAGEPAAPSCWSAGNNNSVWFSFVATNTTMKIKTIGGTLQNTQIAVYSGVCGPALVEVAGSCNDNAPACGFGGSNLFSDVTVAGLSVGATYYVRVDGNGSLMGSFSVLVIDGSQTFPPIQGMDCSVPNPVCVQSFVVGNPGYSGYGAFCDLPTSYCLASGEKNIVWYTIPINANGTLSFDIVPNDFNPATQSATDYDFAVWKIAGSGSVSCAQIAAGTATPLRCNYSGLGVTGLNAATGNAPGSLPASICPTCGAYSPTPWFDGAYEPNIAVNNGDVYLLAVSNFSSSTSGFGIDFLTSPIGYTGSTSTSVTWTGSTSTAWNLNSNWGGCNYPTCGIDAIIVPVGTQPVVTGTMYVRDLLINTGATLTLSAGCTLVVCGNITNNGNLVASLTSTILFNDNSTTHQMSGGFVGTNKVGHLTITDLAGGGNCTVTLNSNLDIGGNFTTTNATSIFNTTGKYIRIAGNFVNSNGNTTFSNVGATGTLEFNGTAAQTYTQGTTNLDLNFVLMNHTGPGVTLLTNMRIKTTTGTLTLTLGKIITNAFEVYVFNTTPACVSIGNVNSYVEGYLRRALQATGNYEFPVGEAVKGYERATVNFTGATTINNLRAHFVQYAATPGPLGVTDCTVPYNLPALNCGKWIINAYDAALTQIPGNGIYDMTLWPRVGSYTNHVGAVEWTVMKDPNNTGAWGLYGTCNLASTLNQVMRSAMTGFSGFGVEQSTTTLPVELISFTGEKQGKIHLLEWQTASELNNDYFALERSADGIHFTEINRQNGFINSTILRTYEYTDAQPLMGMNYYRLRQVNTNGTYTFSNVVALEQTGTQVMVSNVHPNPSDDDMMVDIITSENADIVIEVYDMYGKLVLNKSVFNQAGQQTYLIETGKLSRGVYNLRISGVERKQVYIHRIVRN